MPDGREQDAASRSVWAPAPPSSPAPWLTGTLGRCPRCGRGALFEGLLAPRKDCAACGLDYGFIDSGDGPAVFAVFVSGFLTVGLALWLEFALTPPVWVHVVVWVPFVFLVTIGLLRPMKGVLISLQYRHRAAEGRLAETGAAAGTGDNATGKRPVP